MAKFAWPTFWASAAAFLAVTIVIGAMFKKKVSKDGEVKLEFRGAKPLSGYQNMEAAA